MFQRCERGTAGLALVESIATSVFSQAWVAFFNGLELVSPPASHTPRQRRSWGKGSDSSEVQAVENIRGTHCSNTEVNDRCPAPAALVP
eukprot:8539831-Pyramimonas_sp.AAC.1